MTGKILNLELLIAVGFSLASVLDRAMMIVLYLWKGGRVVDCVRLEIG
jgi:hypothetical protein